MQALKVENAPYLLRWRFEFNKNRASIFGMWNSPNVEAWDKNKEGLAKAIIECKSLVTKKTQVVAECEGHDYRNFQWIAISRVNPNFKGSITPRSEIVGLKILTTQEEVAVLVTGQCAKRKLTEAEKGIHFATFGR